MSRTLRMLVYRLKDVEDALRAAKNPSAADELARAARLFGASPPEDFLEESRMFLINILLGEPQLPPELIGEILDVVGLIDEALLALIKT